MADSKIAVTVHVLLGLQSPCHQEDSPPALISSAIFRLTSPSTLRLRFLWGWYWHLRTRRSKSHIKLCTILGAHLEIAAFVISKQANTSKNKLLSPASARKITFGSSVSCKWTRQLRHLDSINSSFMLNWGLFNHSSTYVASLWRRNTTDTRKIHRINNVCCAVAREKIITGGVNSLKVSWSYRDVYLRLSQNIDPFLDLLGKMNLQTPCWLNWNSLTDTSVASILIFLGLL